MPRPDASGPEHDFDFWVGEWEVLGPEGRAVGTSSITALFGTGAIAEHWRGAGGIEGRSLNAYDRSDGRWHQTWLDSSGGVLFLEGSLVDGAMVLSGAAPGEDPDVSQPQRITWTPEPDGVRQHWQTRLDDGDDDAGWTTVFDGHYRPRRD
jgi:hypothetical protein